MKITCTKGYELRVYNSNAGYFIGTQDEEGFPNCRISTLYYKDKVTAQTELESLHFPQRHYAMETEFCNQNKGCRISREVDEINTPQGLSSILERANSLADCLFRQDKKAKDVERVISHFLEGSKVNCDSHNKGAFEATVNDIVEKAERKYLGLELDNVDKDLAEVLSGADEEECNIRDERNMHYID